MEKTAAELRDEIVHNVEALESELPTSVDGLELSRTSKVPLKVVTCQQSLSRRFVELSLGAISCWDTDRLASALTLSRAAAETFAAAYFLSDEVGRVVTSGNLGDFDSTVMRMLMGTGWPDAQELPQPFRVKKFIEKVEKIVPEFKDSYGNLCEYAHPNWSGTAGLFADYENEHLVIFGSRSSIPSGVKTTCMLSLSGTVLAFSHSYQQIEKLLPEFTRVAEKRLATTT